MSKTRTFFYTCPGFDFLSSPTFIVPAWVPCARLPGVNKQFNIHVIVYSWIFCEFVLSATLKRLCKLGAFRKKSSTRANVLEFMYKGRDHKRQAKFDFRLYNNLVLQFNCAPSIIIWEKRNIFGFSALASFPWPSNVLKFQQVFFTTIQRPSLNLNDIS